MTNPHLNGQKPSGIAVPRKIMEEIRTLVDDGFFINAGELMRSALLLYLARLHDVIAMIWTETPPESEE